MTGNPFRHSQILASTARGASPTPAFAYAESSSTDGSAREPDHGNASLPPPPAPRTKKSKSVRIESPASSPPQPASSDFDDPLANPISRGSRAGSPPPSLTVAYPDDSQSQASVDTWSETTISNDTYGESTMNSSSQSLRLRLSPQTSLSGVPYNPFSRTLAHIEPPVHGGVEADHAGHGRDREPAEPGTPKSNLDVEGFKRLLMTGISSPPGSSPSTKTAAAAPAATPTAPSPFESSSTDTSSVSRQSIFDHSLQEPHHDTPRTSYEMARSDDETLGLRKNARKPEKKTPPPAPKHRHGKLVSPRAPQTVSFSEFEATEFTPASSTSRARTNSDLNKPLPPTPPVLSSPSPILPQDIAQDRPEERVSAPANPSPSSSPPNHQPAAPKKVPPPVPLARRQSQLRTSSGGNRSRSGSNMTTTSQQSISEFPELTPIIPSDIQSSTSSPSHRVPPPPPPTRRHGSSVTGGSTTNSSTTELPSRASSIRRADISASPEAPTSRKPRPSPPPHSSTPTQSSLSRNASTSSNRASLRSISAESTTMPPPPPPPRRRGSARSSLDTERPHSDLHLALHPPSPTESRRTSAEHKRHSIDSKSLRRTSVASESSLRYEYSPAAEHENPLASPQEEVEEPRGIADAATTESLLAVEPAQQSTADILSEMEQFQREIDELRERANKGAGHT